MLQDCCLVPEKREELTTEGGLDVVSQISRMTDVCAQLKAFDVVVSLFIFNAFKFSLLFSACGVGVMSSMQLNHGCTALLGGVNLVFLCIVPEKREELTTEGGLDVVSQISRMTDVCAQLKAFDVVVSLFIDAQKDQIDAHFSGEFLAQDNHILILNMASVFTQVQSNTVCP
jgi:pyridoxine 5'-phosphate synthase PdxJ